MEPQQTIEPVSEHVEFRHLLSLRRHDLQQMAEDHFLERKTSHLENVEQEQALSPLLRLAPQEKELQASMENLTSLLNTSASRLSVVLRVADGLPAEHRQCLQNQLRILELRSLQILMVLYLLERRMKPTFRSLYASLFGDLEKFTVPEDKLTEPLNLMMLKIIYLKEVEYVRLCHRYIEQMWVACQKGQATPDIDLNYLIFRIKRCKVLVSKIYTIAQVFPYVCLASKDDLFLEDLNKSDRWVKLRERAMKVRILGDNKHVRAAFTAPIEAVTQLTTKMNVINAMASKVNQLSNSIDMSRPQNIVDVVKGGIHVLNYAFIAQKAQRRAEFFLSDPDKIIARDIWNLPQSDMARPFIELMLPSIRCMKLLYIPRHFPKISLERVCNWVSERNFGIVEAANQSAPIVDRKLYAEELFKECKDQDQRICIRVLSPFPIERIRQIQQPGFFQRMGAYFRSKPPTATTKTVILHIHGGGFISQTSYVHQLYTRNWANNLNTAIFSVDYRLAPDFPYPAALDDCYQAYMWVLTYLHKVFGIDYSYIDFDPKNIVLVGDSAGGNIIASLTGLLIKLKQSVPKGIVMVYPALSLALNNYSPSLLTSLDDMMLPHTFLKMCLSSYVPEQCRPELDPLVSPILFSNQILSQFPPCRIFIGNKDPFHDDCCRFTQKLMLLQRDIRLVVYDSFPHAFLQLDFPFKQLRYSRIAIDEIEGALRSMLD